MEVTEFTLWIARLGVLALMAVFVLALVVALLADVRAAGQPGKPTPVAPARDGIRLLAVVAGTVPPGGSEYRLHGPLTIGRAPSCDITIPNHFVSSQHARIFPVHGHWYVEDTGSTNGTLMNGTPLTEPHLLSPGDRLCVGDTEFEAR
jgi:pSer/pThr/pTyr-binding forkhead associated (FHA) protein